MKDFQKYLKVFAVLVCICMVYISCSTEEKRKEESGQIESENQKSDEEKADWEKENQKLPLPVSFDLRTMGKGPVAKNQGQDQTCWAFASLLAVESTLLPKEKLVFSAEHMSSQNSFAELWNAGGEYTMAMAYLTSWQGPVVEGKEENGPVKHVQEIQILPEKNYEAIKKAVLQYGGVETSLFFEPEAGYYYQPSENAYYCSEKKNPNHDVVIIGWDDAYPKEKFLSVPKEDGAFLCMNSWGEDFGDKGAFYVSYLDENVGISNVVYSGVEETDNYANIYQADLCGFVGTIGYEEESAYFSNTYTAYLDEKIEAVGFYAVGENTSYDIFYINSFYNEESFQKKVWLQSGSFQYAGFYTVKLVRPVTVRQHQKFAVVIKIHTPGETQPVAIEFPSDQLTRQADLTDGEGYISSQGDVWENTESNHGCNLCLKVYTNYW